MEQGLGRTDRVEIIPRIQSVVTEIFSGRAVNFIGAAFGDNINDRAGVASIFGLEVRKNVDFGHCVDRKDGRGRAKYSRLIDGRVIAVAVIHVSAVEQVVVRASASSVHGKNAIGSG